MRNTVSGGALRVRKPREQKKSVVYELCCKYDSHFGCKVLARLVYKRPNSSATELVPTDAKFNPNGKFFDAFVLAWVAKSFNVRS